MKKTILILIGIMFFGFAIALLPHAKAQNIDCADIRRLNEEEVAACILDSKTREQGYSQAYQETASNTSLYRELVASGEAELKSLSSLAESERVKQRILNRQQASFQKGE